MRCCTSVTADQGKPAPRWRGLACARFCMVFSAIVGVGRHWNTFKKPQQNISDEARKLVEAKVQECLDNLYAAVASGNDPNATIEDADVFCRKFPDRQAVLSKTLVPFSKWQKRMKVRWEQLREQWEMQAVRYRHFTSSGFIFLQRKPRDGLPYGGLLDAEFYNNLGTLMDWYEAARLHATPEEQGIFAPSHNSYESETWSLNAPPWLTQPIKIAVKRALERWAGLPEDTLLFESSYGPRLYRNNSILHRHVDKDTAAFGVVIAVGRRGMQHPWPLEIYDHDGKKHSHEDLPGDVTFIEGATCSHSRADGLLNGREVANYFFHFMPKDWAPIIQSWRRGKGLTRMNKTGMSHLLEDLALCLVS